MILYAISRGDMFLIPQADKDKDVWVDSLMPSCLSPTKDFVLEVMKDYRGVTLRVYNLTEILPSDTIELKLVA